MRDTAPALNGSSMRVSGAPIRLERVDAEVVVVWVEVGEPKQKVKTADGFEELPNSGYRDAAGFDTERVVCQEPARLGYLAAASGTHRSLVERAYDRSREFEVLGQERWV